MTDSLRAAAGRKVVSRASADTLGAVSHLVVDARARRIQAVVVGKGRKARLVEWEHLAGFGPDAVMVTDESALREPADDRDRAAADGKLELVGKRALNELGTELGTVDDVLFDPEAGALEQLTVGGRAVPATALIGSGSYAVVLARDDPAGAPAPTSVTG